MTHQREMKIVSRLEKNSFESDTFASRINRYKAFSFSLLIGSKAEPSHTRCCLTAG
jgi:hypothetical protein